MINRIIEAFTKPKLEITALDEFIQTTTVLIVAIIILIGYIIIKNFIYSRKDKKKENR